MEYIITPEGELYHYGVKGMQWGVRRYQNPDGSLTAAGKKRARQEYRADNETAYELGKNATITGRAAARSMKRTIRLENSLEKRYVNDPDGQKGLTKALRSRWDASSKTTAQLLEAQSIYRKRAEEHCKSLVDKYGQEAVSSIKYKNVKMPTGRYSPTDIDVVNERTNNLTDYARAGAKTVASVGVSAAMGLPVAILFTPKTTARKAYDLETSLYGRNWQEGRRNRRANA